MIASTGAALSLVIRPTEPTTANSETVLAPYPSPVPKVPENWAIYINSLERYAFYYPADWEVTERSEKAQHSAFIAQSPDGGRVRVWSGAFPVSFAVSGELVDNQGILVDGVSAKQRLYRDGQKRTGVLTDFTRDGLAVTVEFTVGGETTDEWISWNTFRDRFHFLR